MPVLLIKFTKFPGLVGLLLYFSLLYGALAETPKEIANKNPLFVDPATQDFSKNPSLKKRILSSPHGYFRFINIPFSKEVCRRFQGQLSQLPFLNLHGDAHLEQYAITDLGRGLTDFDDSSTGPGIIDLMRLGVSLHLAARANLWDDQIENFFEAFLGGYRQALTNPHIIPVEASIVKRIRSKFTINRKGYFKWISSIMDSLAPSTQDSLLEALQPYVQTKLAERPNLTAKYFELIRCGYLRMGIGSALDLKFLIRIKGQTGNPLDDVVLECKEVRDLSGIPCINSGRKLDPFRILVGQTRIAYQPFKHLGYFRFRNRNFWVHSWVDNYKEIKIKKSFQSAKELKEVLYDIGIQLGLGHVKHIATPLDLQLRREQLQFLNNNETIIRNFCRELTSQTILAWEVFRKQINYPIKSNQ